MRGDRSEGRASSAGRGYGAAWRRVRDAHLERVRALQEAAGWPGGPWCECEACDDARSGWSGPATLKRAQLYDGLVAGPAKADTVDHVRPRRLYPVELQGATCEGGSDHPSNLRAMAHAHHSRRREDKAQRARADVPPQ